MPKKPKDPKEPKKSAAPKKRIGFRERRLLSLVKTPPPVGGEVVGESAGSENTAGDSESSGVGEAVGVGSSVDIDTSSPAPSPPQKPTLSAKALNLSRSQNEPMLAELRLVTNAPGQRPMCLGELSDDHLLEVFSLLKSASKTWSYAAIAEHIQTKLGALNGFTTDWIKVALRQLSDAVLGKRRGLAKIKATSKAKQTLSDRLYRREQYAKARYSEIQRLGENLEEWEEEIEFWVKEGRERGTPYDKYVVDLAKVVVEGTKVRHAMRDREGHFKNQVSQIDVNVRQVGLSVVKAIEDPNEFANFMSSFKGRLEGIAEVGELPELTSSDGIDDGEADDDVIDMDMEPDMARDEYCDETELQPEISVSREGCGIDAQPDEGIKPLQEE